MNNATWSGDLPQAKKHRNKENMTPKSMEHGEDHPQGFQNETIITKTWPTLMLELIQPTLLPKWGAIY